MHKLPSERKQMTLSLKIPELKREYNFGVKSHYLGYWNTHYPRGYFCLPCIQPVRLNHTVGGEKYRVLTLQVC